jgi:hypothetical protein
MGEEQLRRDRDKWKRQKAAQRRANHDDKWLARNPGAWIATLEVLHYDLLCNALVDAGYIDPGETRSSVHVDKAVEKLSRDRPPLYDTHHHLYPNRQRVGRGRLG